MLVFIFCSNQLWLNRFNRFNYSNSNTRNGSLDGSLENFHDISSFHPVESFRSNIVWIPKEWISFRSGVLVECTLNSDSNWFNQFTKLCDKHISLVIPLLISINCRNGINIELNLRLWFDFWTGFERTWTGQVEFALTG